MKRIHRAFSLVAVPFAMSCSSADDSSSNTTDDLLGPPPAGQGVQLSMVSTIAPGQEIERCKFFEVPAEGYNVNRATVRYVPGSHHVLLYSTAYEGIPAKNIHGQDLVTDANGVFDCKEGAPADWQVTGVVGGAQSAKAKDAISFPPGVAVKLKPRSVVLINTHYLNATSAPLTAEARINLYTIPNDKVTIEGGVLFFYNPFIRVRPQSSGAARMSCPITSDITLVNGQSHMHRRGVSYRAEIASAAEPQALYESHDWEDVPVEEWSPGLSLHPGQSIDYQCHYQNNEARDVTQGLTTKDEMCMFVGAYYPRERELEQCPTLTPGKGATFIGSGAAAGADTMKCIEAASTSNSTADYYGCVVDSCPGVAKPLTEFVKCHLSGAGGQCDSLCGAGADPDACQLCVKAACFDAIQSLQAAACE